MARVRKRKWVIRVLLLGITLLLALRVVGERKFAVYPAQPATVTVTEGVLKAGVDKSLTEGSGTNLYVPLSDAHLALMSRMLLARHAARTVDLQYYLFHDDEAGRALLGELIAAAQRGVQVRLLLDDMDTKGRDGLFIRLAQDVPNLQVRVFNPVWLRNFRVPEYLARFPRVTRRMHNKSMTADGIATIVGGRNIGNEYFHLQSGVAFADFDVLAGGPVALAVNQVFERYWSSGIAFDMHQLNEPADDQTYQAWRTRITQDTGAFQQKIRSQEGRLAVQNLVEGGLRPYYDAGEVLADPPDKVTSSLFDQSHNMVGELVPLLESAQLELLISSPYFIPGKEGMALFKRLRERGVEITILSNSLRANDVFAVHAGYMQYRQPLLDMGVRLYELRRQPGAETGHSLLGSSHVSLHAKSFIIDRQRVFVGSFNLDPRSAIHNTEMGVVFDSPDYAQRVYGQIDQYLSANAYQVELDEAGNLRWSGIGKDGSVESFTHDPGASWWELGLVTVISWLPVEWLL